jgi:hypothetical protein
MKVGSSPPTLCDLPVNLSHCHLPGQGGRRRVAVFVTLPPLMFSNSLVSNAPTPICHTEEPQGPSSRDSALRSGPFFSRSTTGEESVARQQM